MRIDIHRTEMYLLVDKMVYVPSDQLLIIADAHFTKETHFRKNGIAIPPGVIHRDLHRIDTAIQQTGAKRIIFLGDMFHSEHNTGMDIFLIWRKNQKVAMELITGNHDILDVNWYQDAGILCYAESLQLHALVLSHDAIEVGDQQFNMHGHIHPVVRLTGKAKQSLRLPCFWISSNKMVLPAFGSFTGGYAIQPKSKDQVFAVADHQLIAIHDT